MGKRIFLDLPVDASGIIPVGDERFKGQIKLGQSITANKKIKIERYVIKFHETDSNFLLPDNGYILARFFFGHNDGTYGTSAVRSTTATMHDNSSDIPILITPSTQVEVFKDSHPALEYKLSGPVTFDNVHITFHLSPHYQSVIAAAGKRVAMYYCQLWLDLE